MISSTARAPAMPLPITMRRAVSPGVMGVVLFWTWMDNAGSDLDEPDVDDDVPAGAGGRGEMDLDVGLREQGLAAPQRDVRGRSRADREQAHRLPVAHDRDGDELGAGVAATEVDELRLVAGRHRVGQRRIQQCRLVEPLPLELVGSLQKARL